jgi:hypothetical protein
MPSPPDSAPVPKLMVFFMLCQSCGPTINTTDVNSLTTDLAPDPEFVDQMPLVPWLKVKSAPDHRHRNGERFAPSDFGKIDVRKALQNLLLRTLEKIGCTKASAEC